ncbi:hypothetical protein Pelo_5425 [Pelomyxa schiedti]|nr:hypothetical protein Pelo_5425 [Pelomyxa schiedti]
MECTRVTPVLRVVSQFLALLMLAHPRCCRVALELISGGAKVTVDDLSSILIEHKVSEDTNGATPDSIYFAFTRFSQHRIDTLTTVAKVVPPAVLLSSSPPSAESSSPKAATGKRCPNLLWAACLCRNTTVITSVVSLLNSAASSLSGLESVRGREEQTTTTATTRTTAAETTTTKTTTAEEAARKKEQAKVMMGALVGQRREKDGLTVVEFLTKKGCLDCLNALNSALLL